MHTAPTELLEPRVGVQRASPIPRIRGCTPNVAELLSYSREYHRRLEQHVVTTARLPLLSMYCVMKRADSPDRFSLDHSLCVLVRVCSPGKSFHPIDAKQGGIAAFPESKPTIRLRSKPSLHTQTLTTRCYSAFYLCKGQAHDTKTRTVPRTQGLKHRNRFRAESGRWPHPGGELGL